MTFTRIASALLAVAALSVPAFNSAHACDGDKAETKAPSAETAQKNADKAAQKQDKTQKDAKPAPDQTGKTS
jgi:hypothetical protein